MKTFGSIAAVALAVLVSSPLAYGAGKKAARSDAEALVNRGITLFQEKGPEEGVRIVNQRTKPFLDGELYLFVIGPEGSIVAHAFDESRIGIAANELYDDQGQPYGTLMIKLANDKGAWIPYRQLNPATRKVEPKHSFVRKSNGYIFGCGVYGDQ